MSEIPFLFCQIKFFYMDVAMCNSVHEVQTVVGLCVWKSYLKYIYGFCPIEFVYRYVGVAICYSVHGVEAVVGSLLKAFNICKSCLKCLISVFYQIYCVNVDVAMCYSVQEVETAVGLC